MGNATKTKRKPRGVDAIKIERGVPPPVVNNWPVLFTKMKVDDHFDVASTTKSEKNFRSSIYLASRRVANTIPGFRVSVKKLGDCSYRVWRIE